MPTALAFAVAATDLSASAAERQLTTAPHGHVLANINVWSPDSQSIVYDVRALESVFAATRIEQVNVAAGEIQRLYESKTARPAVSLSLGRRFFAASS